MNVYYIITITYKELLSGIDTFNDVTGYNIGDDFVRIACSDGTLLISTKDIHKIHIKENKEVGKSK